MYKGCRYTGLKPQQAMQGVQSSYFTMGYKAELYMKGRNINNVVGLIVGTEVFKLVEGIPSTDQNHSGMQI